MPTAHPDRLALIRALAFVNPGTVRAARPALSRRLCELAAGDLGRHRATALLAQHWRGKVHHEGDEAPADTQVLLEAVEDLTRLFLDELARAVVGQLKRAGPGEPATAQQRTGSTEKDSRRKPASPPLLVLEDHADTRDLLGRLLAPAYTVTLTSTDDEALAAARRRFHEAVILDINLGEKRTGCDVLGAVSELLAIPKA